MRAQSSLALFCLLPLVAAASTLTIAIEPRFQGDPLRLDALIHQNAAGETVAFSRVSYLLGGFALERDDGKWIEITGLNAWMDAATRRSDVVVTDIPPARYRAVRFHVGPDAIANAAHVGGIAATDPLNPNVNGLHWSWQGGYIFMAIEGHFRTGNDEPRGFAYHLARDPNRTLIHLSADLDLTRDAGLLAYFDLAGLLNAPRGLSFGRDGTATHSRDGDPVAAALVRNLPGAFRIHRVDQAPAAGSTLPILGALDMPVISTPYGFTINRTFPLPDLPRDNPLILERVQLGEKLFHDPSLSADATISCATCHQHARAFTDGLARSAGIKGRVGDRNAMPLANLAWKKEFFWDGRARSLRAQVMAPIQDHREMDADPAMVVAKLAKDPEYPAMFAAAFRSPGISPEKLALALEQYLLTLTARDSKFDRAMAGKVSLTAEEQRGLELFMTEYEPRTGQMGADCFHCHGGPLFTDHQFHDNGLGGNDPGRAKVTGLATDAGKFATPSLRNVALTAPYMHDGRFATLPDAVEHYISGVERGPILDPNLAKHPGRGVPLDKADTAALVAFLKTLTDTSLAAGN